MIFLFPRWDMLVPSHNHKLEVICPKRRRLILSSNGTRQFESGAWLGSSSFGRSRSWFWFGRVYTPRKLTWNLKIPLWKRRHPSTNHQVWGFMLVFLGGVFTYMIRSMAGAGFSMGVFFPNGRYAREVWVFYGGCFWLDEIREHGLPLSSFQEEPYLYYTMISFSPRTLFVESVRV